MSRAMIMRKLEMHFSKLADWCSLGHLPAEEYGERPDYLGGGKDFLSAEAV